VCGCDGVEWYGDTVDGVDICGYVGVTVGVGVGFDIYG